MYNLIKKILKPVSVSGREDNVRGVIAEEIQPYADSITIDRMGNLIAFMEGKSASKKKVMYAAHIDEIGFMVTYIEENGFIRANAIGGINFISAAFTRVEFENGVRGILVPEAGTPATDLKQDKFVVDIGAKNRREAERLVSIGDTFAVVSGVEKLAGTRICGRPIDDKIGAVILIEAAKKIREMGGPENDIYMAFTVQEEVGLRGSKTASYSVMPDIGIALDVTGTGDSQGAKPMAIKLGGGAAIKIKDASVVCDRALVEKMKSLASDNKVKYQLEVLTAGGTDTASMQQIAGGAIAGCISIPTRYIHSSVETIDTNDVKECVKLTVLTANADYSDII